MRRQLRAVVTDDHPRTAAAPLDDPVELTTDPQARQRCVGDETEALTGEVVNDCQHPEPAPVGQRVRDKVQRPALVRCLRQRHWRARSQCSFPPAPLAHAEFLLAVEPEQALVVQSDTITPQQDVQSPVAEPPSLTGQHAQPGTDLAVARSFRDIPIVFGSRPTNPHARRCE